MHRPAVQLDLQVWCGGLAGRLHVPVLTQAFQLTVSLFQACFSPEDVFSKIVRHRSVCACSPAARCHSQVWSVAAQPEGHPAWPGPELGQVPAYPPGPRWTPAATGAAEKLKGFSPRYIRTVLLHGSCSLQGIRGLMFLGWSSVRQV